MNPNMVNEIRNRIGRFDTDQRPTAARFRTYALDALTLAGKIEADAKKTRDNTIYPLEHRQKMLREAVTGNLKLAQLIEQKIADDVKTLRNEKRARERLPTAPSDPVSIQIRSELRARLLAMPSDERLKAVDIKNIDAMTLQAVLEAPASLSGVPAPILDHLRHGLVVAKGAPNYDEADAEIENITRTALAVARQAIVESSEMNEAEVQQRLSSVRSEMTLQKDMTDAPLSDLLAFAQTHLAT